MKITIIFKPTERCNSNCIYCDVISKPAIPDMSAEMLELVFRRMGEFLALKPDNEINLVWHGGEPLILGPGYFQNALEIQARHCGADASRIHHRIQSNLTLFREEFVAPLRALGVKDIGTSFEPVPNVRGFGPKRDSGAYARKFLDAVVLLEKNGIKWNYIYVATKRSLPKAAELYYFLTNLSNARSVMVNPVIITGEDRHGLAITPGEFAAFLGEFFRLWWKARDKFNHVQPFMEYVDMYTGASLYRVCTTSGNCAYSHMYIGPDGSASHCGRAADCNIVSYGNIKDMSLSDVMDHELRRKFMKRDAVLKDGECKGCRFWEICHGDCPLGAYEQYGDSHRRHQWGCEFRKIFLEKYFEPISGLRYEPKNQ